MGRAWLGSGSSHLLPTRSPLGTTCRHVGNSQEQMWNVCMQTLLYTIVVMSQCHVCVYCRTMWKKSTIQFPNYSSSTTKTNGAGTRGRFLTKVLPHAWALTGFCGGSRTNWAYLGNREGKVYALPCPPILSRLFYMLDIHVRVYCENRVLLLQNHPLLRGTMPLAETDLPSRTLRTTALSKEGSAQQSAHLD